MNAYCLIVSLFQLGLGDADRPSRQGSEGREGMGQCYGTFHVPGAFLCVSIRDPIIPSEQPGKGA